MFGLPSHSITTSTKITTKKTSNSNKSHKTSQKLWYANVIKLQSLDFRSPNMNRASDANLVASTEIKQILGKLSLEELDAAARTHHQYRMICSGSNHNDYDIDKTKTRTYFASKMIQRYLSIHDNNIERVLQSIRETLKFRNSIDIDHLIASPTNQSSEYFRPIRNFLSTKRVYVQGYDRAGRSTYYFIPRMTQKKLQEKHQPKGILPQKDKDEDTMIKGYIWTMERAIACSKCPDQTINAVVDFEGFSPSKHGPSVKAGKELMTILSKHYVHHMNNIYLVDAPFAFLCIWSVFKKFACKRTSSKIHFIKSASMDNQSNNNVSQQQQPNQIYQESIPDLGSINYNIEKNDDCSDIELVRSRAMLKPPKLLRDLYTLDQLPSWMGGMKTRELDVMEYLDKTPFDESFDE